MNPTDLTLSKIIIIIIKIIIITVIIITIILQNFNQFGKHVTYIRYIFYISFFIFIFQACNTSRHISYDFIFSKSLNRPVYTLIKVTCGTLIIKIKKLNLCLLHGFKGFHLCIKWVMMWYTDNQLRKKLNLFMLLQANKNILCKNRIRIKDMH